MTLEMMRPERFAQAVQFMDDHYPNWWEIINLHSLYMTSPKKCIIGQTCHKHERYSDVKERFEEEYEQPAYPFACLGYKDYWIDLIKQRRQMNQHNQLAKIITSQQEVLV